MPKYLLEVSYTAEGTKGLLKDGGSKRKQTAEAALKSVGGNVDAFYFAFGDTDAYALVDAPDHASVTAASMYINAAGAVRLKTIVLITPEEVDKAAKKAVTYQSPGR